MARLPSGRFLIQQIGRQVILFEEYTEREIARFDPSDQCSLSRMVESIRDSELDDPDKAWAHFWSGYFYGQSGAKAAVAQSILDDRPRVSGEADFDGGFGGAPRGWPADGSDFGRYDFPNLGSPGPDRDSYREW
jgi:hypothetical protein